MKKDEYRRNWATKVKAHYDYLCAECDSDENIQAHDPTEQHKDWTVGIALCGNCHSKKHPDVPRELFLSSSHQSYSYWPNISARALSREIGCHNRTVIRAAKKLKILMGSNLSDIDKQRIKDSCTRRRVLEVRSYKVEPKVYALAQERAKKNNTTLSKLVRDFVVKYATRSRTFSFFWR